MPRLSDSMEEGTIVAWLKNDGEAVTAGEEIVEIETDKATMAYAAEESGTLHIVAAAGATIAVGQPMARIGDPEVPATAEIHAEASVAAGSTSPAQNARAGSVRQASVKEGEHAAGARNGNGSGTARIKASPLARRVATQLGVALDSLVGSGPNGRIVKADVERAASGPPAADSPGERREELTRLQQTIVSRMVASRAEIPDFTVSVDVDAQPLTTLRTQLKAAVVEGQSAPSVNDLIIKAVALALTDRPRANASYREGAIVLHDRVNIGFAVAGQGALLVPVIHDADVKSVGHIARESRALAHRAREGHITPSELDGGTFTISNLGMYGALDCIPVINGAQAAIIGVGAVRTEPVVANGELAIGQRLKLTIACDHRILYGADAAELLGAIRSLLERPLSLAL
jgi:pyruvate dehydrogenase E2 component (dihydrolipoyllysine-residue acetyltransferase)